LFLIDLLDKQNHKTTVLLLQYAESQAQHGQNTQSASVQGSDHHREIASVTALLSDTTF